MQPTQPVAHLHPPHTTCVCAFLCAPPPPAVVRQVYGEYGVGGFWNGAAASLVMVVNPTLQYALYEWLLQARSKLRCGQPVGRGVRGRGWGVTAAAEGKGLVHAVRCCTQQRHPLPAAFLCVPAAACCCCCCLWAALDCFTHLAPAVVCAGVAAAASSRCSSAPPLSRSSCCRLWQRRGPPWSPIR